MQSFLHRHTQKLLALCCIAASLSSEAQTVNKPRLDQAGPQGGLTNNASYPPAITVNSSELFNYVRGFTPKIPIDDPAQLTTAAAPSDVTISTLYKDGFNRSMQIVQHHFTPGRSLVGPSDTRFQAEENGYLPYSAPGFGFRANAFSEQMDYYSSLYPNESYSAYSQHRTISSAGRRGEASFAPGKSQVGQGNATIKTLLYNTANSIRLWRIDGGSNLPVSNGYYEAGQLLGEKVTMPGSQGMTTITYKDRTGKMIMEQASESSGNLNTLYIYDAMGRLRYIVPPLAAEGAIANGSLDQATLDKYCFQYRYDEKGRKVEQKMPGKEVEYFIYDKRNRLVIYQDGNQRAAKLWAYHIYDRFDRETSSGLMVGSGGREQVAAYLDFTTSWPADQVMLYLSNNTIDDRWHVYPPENMPGCTPLSYTYYDDYREADPNSTLWNTWAANQLQTGELQYPNSGAETPQRSDRTQGRVTGSRIKILASPGADPAVTGDWRNTAVYYDDKGRLIYSASQERDASQNVLHESYSSSQYSFSGQVLAAKQKHFNYKSGDGHTGHTEVNKNEYEPTTGRLLKTWRKVDNATAWTQTSSYTYDQLGRVQRKVLGNNGEVQDFTYNIRSQLTGINGAYAETGNKQGQSLTFGESLKYDYGFDKPRYDGKIAGQIWRGSDGDASVFFQPKMHAYGYDYDLVGRLKSADYNLQRSGMNPWNKTELDYSVSNLNYDLNGNIQTMNQRGVKPGTGPVNMDMLSYTYTGNQLMDVKDDGVANYGAGDFQNGTNTGDDYKYDPNGNLVQDRNKGIDSVTYNYLNKPTGVFLPSGRKIVYSYDAAGAKVQELVTEPGKPVKRTDYVGNFVYQNDTLQYALTADGRTAFNYTTANPVKEEYFVKDHLGNVRSTIDIVTYGIQQYLAGYEVASANLEGLLFEKVGEIRDDKPGSTDPGDVKAGRLNGAETGREVGTSLLVKVMAGDRVDLNVNNYYESFSKKDEPLSPDYMLQSVISTLTGGVGGFPGESHNTELVGQLFTPNNFTVLDNVIREQGIDPNKPQAFLTYALFDENMKLVTSFSGAYQVNGEGTWGSIGTDGAKVIPANGYLAVYLSSRYRNLTCVPCGNIFFDKLNVEISKGNLLAEDHYYPHGLPIKGLSSSRTAPEGFRENRRKYQGNEYITDLDLNWMSFGARQYDPQIGRFLSVDPIADAGGQQVWSPYSAMGNAPESQVDPNGTIPAIHASPFRWLDPYAGRIDELAQMPTAETLMPWGENFNKGKADVSWADGFDWKASEAFWGQAATGYAAVEKGKASLYTAEGGFTSNSLTQTNTSGDGAKAAVGVGAVAATAEATAVGVAIEVTAASLAAGVGIVAGVLLPTPAGTGSDKVIWPGREEFYNLTSTGTTTTTGTVTATNTKTHGNNKNNKNPHSVYMIYSTGPDGLVTEKYGITGRVDKPENRPQYQVNKFNSWKNGKSYGWMWVQTNLPNRSTALLSELYHVTQYAKEHGVLPARQFRPDAFRDRTYW